LKNLKKLNPSQPKKNSVQNELNKIMLS